jgi:propionyl-CoA carboxylase alpha chain
VTAVPGSDSGAAFYFLEMNTRLQVEHPVTELTTGLDLVQTQLRVAAGHPLDLRQADVTRTGHAVEVRLVAEDPALGWLPSSGVLARFETPDVPDVRWDTGVETGSSVPSSYDSLIAKVIAHGRDRDESLDRLRTALRGLRVHGVATNREALLALVDDPDVRAGRTTIDFLARWTAGAASQPAGAVLDRHAIAAALAAQAARGESRPARATVPLGWRSMADAIDVTDLRGPEDRRVVLRTDRAGLTTVAVGDAVPSEVVVHRWDSEWLDHEVDGVRRRAAVLMTDARDDADAHIEVFLDGVATSWVEPARLPAGDRSEAARGPSSPVPGTIVAVHVVPGDIVKAGDDLVVLEAMKMEHRLTADTDAAVVEVAVAVGDAVDAHEVLVVLEPTSPDAEPEG